MQLTALAAVLCCGCAAFAAWWQVTSSALIRPSGLALVVAVALAAAALALLSQGALLASALTAGPLRQRAVALRRKSWGAVFQRQLNPDAPGRARPRAPSGVPAAA
jgi:Family of unknown function (DUF6412)